MRRRRRDKGLIGAGYRVPKEWFGIRGAHEARVCELRRPVAPARRVSSQGINGMSRLTGRIALAIGTLLLAGTLVRTAPAEVRLDPSRTKSSEGLRAVF